MTKTETAFTTVVEVPRGLGLRAARRRLLKAAMIARHGTIRGFADAAGEPLTLITQVYLGYSRSRRIERKLADLVGIPVEKLFPPSMRQLARACA